MAQNHGLINSISDLTKYRIDKNYILSEKSSEFLKRNKNWEKSNIMEKI